MIEIEPNPKLVKYFEVANQLDCHSDDFTNRGEWHYIQSDIERNIFLIKDLDELGLLSDEVNIVDCGIGLGTVMFDLYLQSLEIEGKKFTFTGIEKDEKYINYFKENLLDMWSENFELIESDIRDCDFQKFNFIFMFQPFKFSNLAMPFYKKVIMEAKRGTIILGIDQYNVINFGDEELVSEFKKHKMIPVGEWIILQIV